MGFGSWHLPWTDSRKIIEFQSFYKLKNTKIIFYFYFGRSNNIGHTNPLDYLFVCLLQ